MDQRPPPGAPTRPIELAGGPAAATARLDTNTIPVSDQLIDRLRATGAEVTTEPAARAEASRDWWPLAMSWATEGQVAALAGVVVRPADAEQVASVVRLCNETRTPLTVAAGRSGVCGASVPLHGGVVLDLCALSGIDEVDDQSLVTKVRAGTFGGPLETELRDAHGLTLGHRPQSIELSTVGGWLACRSAGQLSTRYGKIEDIVVGLDVVLADGRPIRTGGPPRQAVGPDLTQLFVGSEGTLGVITAAELRLRPAPTHTRQSAYGLRSFPTALDCMRRILRRGVTPAALRLYDATEAARSFETTDVHLLLAYDEGDPAVVDPALAVIGEEAAAAGAEALDAVFVDRWLARRDDVSALEPLIAAGYVVDTMEVSGRWSDLARIHEAAVAALLGVKGTITAFAHQSHSYVNGGCLYFTFGGQPDDGDRDRYYRAMWDAGQRAVLANGGSLSHHHGIGLNRARFMADALGPAFDVLVATKAALDPNGILNPGKLGMPDPFGPVEF